MDKCVAYLDILGFGNYTRSDPQAALELISDYHAIITSRITDDKLHPPASYPDETLRTLASQRSVDSFECFLPFSDSVFIVAKDANRFLPQLSTFLIHSFTFAAHMFDAASQPDDPTVFGRGGRQHLYPLLFRSGVSFGEVLPLHMNAIEQSQIVKFPNLTGRGLVAAVGLEESGFRGPRVLCGDEFVGQLNAQSKRFVAVAEVKGKQYHEVLWPAFHFIESNPSSTEIYELHDLFDPAVRLWAAFKDKECGDHYYEFVKLIVKSTVKFFELRGEADMARDYISAVIQRQRVDLKLADLLVA
jgi:hypothetical protein